jgi:hypothetical protein
MERSAIRVSRAVMHPRISLRGWARINLVVGTVEYSSLLITAVCQKFYIKLDTSDSK